MRTQLEVTQEEIHSSIDEQDAQNREEGCVLLTSTQEVLNIDEEPEMDCGGTRWINGLEWTRQHKQREQYD